MKIRYLFILMIMTVITPSCKPKAESIFTAEVSKKSPFFWKGANVYFLITDRFNNGNPDNDLNFDRTTPSATGRGFMGGDLKGITQKIEEGYFTALGVNAIWFTPIIEQIHDFVDEGSGRTYGFHGYWAKDWSNIDANFGTYADLEELVKTAHAHNIRLLMDVVLNHTGPVTPKDPYWGKDWARIMKQCTYNDYESTVECTLVKNLPDIRTERKEEVALPQHLVEKWKAEGRYEQEMKELDLFFESSGLKRTPSNYIIKWLTDYVRELGIDGFRVDTVKHVNEETWSVLRTEANRAFASWKNTHPEEVLDDNPFYMIGEVYDFYASGGRKFDFGNKKVDYFNYGFDNLINFEFKRDALKDYESLFSKYDTILNNQLKGKSVLNYASSHDDHWPFDLKRNKPYQTATKLLLCPGLSQIYYGDEIARKLTVAGAVGDANLRSFMNWEKINDPKTQDLLGHWQKVGKFRRDHPAVGAGKHTMLSKAPFYVFSRVLSSENYEDKVIIGLDLPEGKKIINTKGVFKDGVKVRDAYTQTEATVIKGIITISTINTVLLLERIQS